MSRTFFTGAHLIDGHGGVQSNVTVVVDGNSIAEVGDAVSTSQPQLDDVVYDLAGRTLMPGMVAGHAHLSYPNFDPEDLNSIDMKYPATYIAVIATKNAEATLRAGCTAAAGAGSVHQIDRVLKDLIREGVIPGPRLM